MRPPSHQLLQHDQLTKQLGRDTSSNGFYLLLWGYSRKKTRALALLHDEDTSASSVPRSLQCINGAGWKCSHFWLVCGESLPPEHPICGDLTASPAQQDPLPRGPICCSGYQPAHVQKGARTRGCKLGTDMSGCNSSDFWCNRITLSASPLVPGRAVSYMLNAGPSCQRWSELSVLSATWTTRPFVSEEPLRVLLAQKKPYMSYQAARTSTSSWNSNGHGVKVAVITPV